MKRFLLLALLLLASPALADDVQGLVYNPSNGTLQANTRANNQTQVGANYSEYNQTCTSSCTTQACVLQKNTGGGTLVTNSCSVRLVRTGRLVCIQWEANFTVTGTVGSVLNGFISAAVGSSYFPTSDLNGTRAYILVTPVANETSTPSYPIMGVNAAQNFVGNLIGFSTGAQINVPATTHDWNMSGCWMVL